MAVVKPTECCSGQVGQGKTGRLKKGQSSMDMSLQLVRGDRYKRLARVGRGEGGVGGWGGVESRRMGRGGEEGKN